MNKLTTNLSLKPLILSGLVILAGLDLASAGNEPTPEVRKWKSHDGNYSVTASLAGFDRATRKVSLNKADATVIKVPLDRLSAADRAFVADHIQGQANPTEPAGKTKTLHGIQWQPQMEDALAEAAGEATPDDDRPVMWFRVLGELEQDL